MLIRNHENRSRAGEITGGRPEQQALRPRPLRPRRQHQARRRAGTASVIESFAVLGGTHTNCAGGQTPWDTWITCEEIFNYGSVEANTAPPAYPARLHLRGPRRRQGPGQPAARSPTPGASPTRPWPGSTACSTRPRTAATPASTGSSPRAGPREFGDLAAFGGTLEALVVSGHPNLDMNTVDPGEEFHGRMGRDRGARSATTDTGPLRGAGQRSGDLRSHRGHLGGRTAASTSTAPSGGEAQLGQLWELTPQGPQRWPAAG